MTRRPLPSAGSLGIGSPGLHGTMGRSDSRPSLSPHFVAFAWRYHPCAAVRSHRPRRAAVGSGELVFRVPSRNCWWKRTGLPGSQGPLVCLGPVLRPRRDRSRQASCGVSAWSPRLTRARTPAKSFRGSIARPRHWLSTLRSEGHPSPRKTRFRLLAKLCRAGFVYPQGCNERFPSSSLFLLSRALPDAMTPFFSFGVRHSKRADGVLMLGVVYDQTNRSVLPVSSL